MRIGPPIAPPALPSVEAWTEAIERALLDVTLNADDWEDHEVVAAVEALYGRSVERDFLEGEEGLGRVGRSFRVRQLLLAARGALEKTNPGEVASLARHALAFNHLLSRIRLSPAALDEPPPVSVVVFHTLKALLFVLLGFPVAVLGAVAWWVPYRLCGLIANRVPGAADQRDQIALYKLLSGALLFPVTLAAWTAAAWVLGGSAWGVLALVVLPFAGIISLVYLEHAEWRERQARELLALAFMPGGIARLRVRRDALVAECDRLAKVFRRTSDNPSA